MLNVMLVDDEIMVLKHMENIVDWETNGFQIASVETRAIQGIEKLHQSMIDVIFVDIRMPGMDGFEFSKRAIKINPNVEIIILTSYGDFDYAKEALKIGVSSYLLKHEMNQENFEGELKQIRSRILSKKRDNQVILSQFLLKHLSFPKSMKPDELDYIRKMLSIANKNIISFLVVRDREIFPAEKKQGESLFEEELINYIELNYKGMVPILINNDECLVVTPFNPIISQREILEKIHINAYELQRHIKKQFSKSVSIIPSFTLLDIEDLPNVYRDLKALEKYLIFFDQSKILYRREINLMHKTNENKINTILRTIETALRNMNTQLVLKEINLFFAACEKNFDTNGFYYFMDSFQNLLRNFYQEYQMIYTYDRDLNFVEEVYSVFEMHEKIELFIEKMMVAVEQENLNQYSSKIKSVIMYLMENYMYDIKIEDVAEQTNISGEYLRHIFKDEVGKGFSEYLTELRIEKAKALLAEDKYKLYEIAEMVGYSSGSYFGTVFKKVTGMKPQRYVGECNE